MYSQKSAIRKLYATLSDNKTSAKMNFMLKHMNTDVKLEISTQKFRTLVDTRGVGNFKAL
jgi:hypothetical protein